MSSTALHDLDLANQLATQIQPMQNSQLNEFRLFYQPPNDDNFYHVTFKMILQLSENYYDDYDYEFFYQGSDANYYVTCKLLPHPLIVNILNKEIYGIDFDVNDLKRKYTLTWNQKLNLEQSLKRVLSFLQEKFLKSYFPNTLPTQQVLYFNNGLFYQPSNDINIYHITCKITLQDQGEDDFDYEFFYKISNDDIRHITCKILPPSLILNILNKKIYGIDFDVNDLKRRHTLTLQQKLNLELSLTKLFLYIPERGSDFYGNTISYHENIDNQNLTQQ
ncbi:hypothetical protein RclHR1_00750002 [Rhizophagus clarus]|uniref:Uncharacterized protein n=1 Tax=Rhizophagus clarus TaxID=94130 RepID=A0A2Z6RWL4_9GLOM|nr:hypothetical protein RclHR1_00750002 [Rhizophagus clarus]GES85870.1 hypothetical protein GLOIN_2v1871432 [Rhizophagus clarus]